MLQDPKTPFKRLENLSTFIQACRSFGVMEYELFSTSDVRTIEYLFFRYRKSVFIEVKEAKQTI